MVSHNPDAAPTSLQMELLPFQLPDFCRVSWVSDVARNVWERRIHDIVAAWTKLEWLSVYEGLRECCFVFATIPEFMDRGVCWAELGLNSMPIQIQGIPAGGYASTPVPWKDGEPFQFRFVVGRPESVVQFRAATLERDDQAMGELLGYPKCCQRFFKDIWVDQGLVDTTWPMSLNMTSAERKGRCIDVKMSPPQSNILWRWMGVRPVSHLPCSFSCQSTIDLANNLIELGRRNDFGQEMDWLMEILQWPVEWSALHGIAEVKTPVLKVSTRTDATARKHIVRFHGNSFPHEGATGLNFPYHSHQATRLTDAVTYRKGLENPIAELSLSPPWLWHDNGFTSEFAMNAAHRQVMEVARTVLHDAETVLDLGCGNGALLKRLLEGSPMVTPFGIDINATAIKHSSRLLPKFSDNFVLGDLFDEESLWNDNRQYSLVLLMPGRLIERKDERSERLLQRIAERCHYILAYAYGDWIERYGTLAHLAEAAGLTVINMGPTMGASLVKVKS